MRDVNILPTIAINVSGVDAHARLISPIFTGRDAGIEGDIFKRSVVLIDKQKVWPGIVGNRDIGPAVVVKVGEHDSHTFRFGLTDAGRLAHVGEGSVVIVMVELGLLSAI